MDGVYICEAVKIGDQILAEAISNADGLYWETGDIDNGVAVKVHQTDIYSGSAGILYFILCLYRATGDKKYIPYLKEGTRHLYTASAATMGGETSYAFYTGQLGIAYVLAKIGDALDDHVIKKNGDSLVDVNYLYLAPRSANNDFLVGAAGVLYGLLNFYDLTNDKRLVNIIASYVDHILKHASLGDVGLYWNKDANQISGLCGMAHGSSGVGMALLEVGVYFQWDRLVEIGLLAFDYENDKFDFVTNNWPDFRCGMYSDQDAALHREKIFSGDISFFEKPNMNMLAWCHGAPGALLARFRSLNVLNYKNNTLLKYHDISTRTLDASMPGHDDMANFTICHGHAGTGLAFLEMYKYSSDSQYLHKAQHIADLCVESKNNFGAYLPGIRTVHGEDLSLFNGIAGIGYYYLLVEDGRIDNLFSSKFKNSKAGSLPADRRLKGLENLMSSFFPLTIQYISETLKDIDLFSDFNGELRGFHVMRFFIEKRNKMNADLQKRLNDVFKLELKINDKERRIRSFAYLKAHRVFVVNEYAATIDRVDTEATLILSHFFEIHTTQWRWEQQWMSVNNEEEEGLNYVLLSENEFGCQCTYISEFSYSILNFFQSKNEISGLLAALNSVFDIDSSDSTDFESIVEGQIMEFLKSGILIYVN